MRGGVLVQRKLFVTVRPRLTGFESCSIWETEHLWRIEL